MTAARCLVLIVAVLGTAAAAHADESFRCGKWIVTSQMTVGEITSKCGPPASRASRSEDVMVRNRNTGLMMKTGVTIIETLTWDRGTTAAAMVVTVVDGAVKSIERQR